MKVVAVVNQKGGVAKTTTTIHLSADLANRGFKVLVIDFDPQGNATTGLGIDKLDCKYTAYELIKKYDFAEYHNLELKDVIINRSENLDIIPINIKSAKANIEINALRARELKLKKVIKEIRELKVYDYVFIDCQPSLSVLVDNALTAADSLIIPCAAEPAAIEGIADMLDTIERIKEDINDTLTIEGVLLTKVNTRTNMHKEIYEYLEKYFGPMGVYKDKLYKTLIRNNTKIAEAYKNGQTIYELDPKANGSIDYKKFVDEFLNKN